MTNSPKGYPTRGFAPSPLRPVRPSRTADRDFRRSGRPPIPANDNHANDNFPSRKGGGPPKRPPGGPRFGGLKGGAKALTRLFAGRIPDFKYYPKQDYWPEGFDLTGWRLIAGPYDWLATGGMHRYSRNYADNMYVRYALAGQWIQSDVGQVVDNVADWALGFGIWFQIDHETLVAQTQQSRSAMVAAYERGVGTPLLPRYDEELPGRAGRRAINLPDENYPQIDLDPVTYPPRLPKPDIAPLPWRARPKQQPNPFRSPTEQDQRGHGTGASGRPGVSQITRVETEVDPDAPPKPPIITKEPELREPPARRTKEGKLKFKGSWALGELILGTVTEGMDFVTALWDALPKQRKGRWFINKDGRWMNTDSLTEKAQKVFDHWDEIDKGEALRNVVNNQLEDWWVGKTQRGFNKHANNYHPGVFGRGRGPAMEDSWGAFYSSKPQFDENWNLTWS